MASMEEKNTHNEQLEEDWTDINTGLGFHYVRGDRFKWSPLVKDVPEERRKIKTSLLCSSITV